MAEAYNPHVPPKCPKCGYGEISLEYQYHTGTYECLKLLGCFHRYGVPRPGGGESEHFHRECRRCSYEWPELVLTQDATSE